MTPAKPILTNQQKEDCARYWRDRYIALEGKVHKDVLEQLGWFGDPSAFGYDQGEIRDGELGKWDIYYFITQGGADLKHQADALLITGLTLGQINQVEDRWSGPIDDLWG